MDELQKFENWINENCYMNGGRLQVYGTIRRDVATYYKENQAKNNEVLDIVIKWRPISSVEGYEWITAQKENIRVKLNDGSEGRYNDRYEPLEVTHVAF